MIRVNLGCGTDIREGWVNCDVIKRVGVDKVFDINGKWDLEDDSVDYLESDVVIEHIQDLENFLRELHRVLKVFGHFKIITVNSFFWRYRIKFLFGQYARTSGFHLDHCWLFKPSELATIFRQHYFKLEIKGRGLLPYPDLCYARFDLVGYKFSKGNKK